MKIITLFLSILLTSLNLCAEDSKILGTWKSDLETTLKFIEENAKIPEERLKVLKPMFGKSTITFNKGGKGTVTTVAYELQLKDGKTIKMPANTQSFSYEILGETDKQVVVKTILAEQGDAAGLIKMMNKTPFSITVFADRDHCWTYLSNGFMEFHAREYFVRVKAKTHLSKEHPIVAKLDRIVIPRVDFSEVPVGDALDFASLRARALDPENDPARKGISILLQMPVGGDDAALDLDLKENQGKDLITYKAERVRYLDLIAEIAKQANLDAYLTSVGILVIPEGKPPFPNAKADQGEIWRVLRKAKQNNANRPDVVPKSKPDQDTKPQ